MTDVPHIYIDNVARYYWEQVPDGSKAKEFAPVVAPPFPRAIFDYRWPVVLHPKDHQRVHLRVEMNALPLDDEYRKNIKNQHWGEPAWMIALWSEQDPMGPNISLLVAADGGHCSDLYIRNVENEDASFRLAMLFSPCLLAITFMHCKNVEIRDIPPTRQQRRQAERKNKPLITYKELIIDPLKKQVRNEAAESQGGERGRALHICRGHFATYSEERPLFGKVSGTFWIPMHVKGNKQYGEVKKDYKVKP